MRPWGTPVMRALRDLDDWTQAELVRKKTEAGKLPRPDIAVEWSPPRFEAVDPLKDAMADLLALRSGTMSLAQAIARQGHNPDAVLAGIAAMNAKIDALGLILDSDPRRVTKTGVMQADPAGQPDNPDT